MMESDNVPEFVNVILRYIAAVEGAFIIVGHLFVLGLFYQQGTGGRLSDYHIISLMCSDLIQGVLNVPLYLYLTNGLRVGDPSCYWSHWLGGTSAMMQIFIILAMTLDRYWAIVHPLHYRKNATKEKTFALIAVGWGIGLFLGTVALFLRVTPSEPNLLCVFSEQLFNKDFIAFAVLLVILPSNIIMAVLYVKIYRVIIASMREFSPHDGTVDKLRRIIRGTSISDISTSSTTTIVEGTEERERMREYRTMLILTMIVCLYFIGWAPSPIFYVFLKLRKIPLTMYMLAGVLNFLHSTLNPLIYALNIKERKQAAKSLIQMFVCKLDST